jgi:hypothetical protein
LTVGAVVSLCATAVLIAVVWKMTDGEDNVEDGRIRISVQMFEGPEWAAMGRTARAQC